MNLLQKRRNINDLVILSALNDNYEFDLLSQFVGKKMNYGILCHAKNVLKFDKRKQLHDFIILLITLLYFHYFISNSDRIST